MGQVAVTMKVILEGPDVDAERVKQELVTRIKNIRQIEEKEIAFGLKYFEILLVFEDRPGGTDEIENKILEIPGVASVESGDITLI